MADPELAGLLVRRAHRKAVVHARVREERGVEVDAKAFLARPLHPGTKVLVGELVTVVPGILVREDRVACVQVHALGTGDKARGVGKVGRELVEVARAAGVVARGHDAARRGVVALVKALDVVALPAVHRDGLGCQARERCLGVNAAGGVACAGSLVGRGLRGHGACVTHGVVPP